MSAHKSKPNVAEALKICKQHEVNYALLLCSLIAEHGLSAKQAAKLVLDFSESQNRKKAG